MDDHEAVRLCRAGDKEAFRSIGERYEDVLYGMAYLIEPRNGKEA